MDFYTRFTEHFRGNKDDIKHRLRVYLPVVEPLLADYPGAPVLDLGSGRGEWLELMSEQGWNAAGIDMNAHMAEDCRQRGLDVAVNDALSALEQSADASYITITGFHIAEHLAFDDLRRLIDEALRVLMPGGLLIFETPNPENLTVGQWSFYLDPTHRHPLPPPLLHFTVEDAGFSEAHVLRLNGPTPPADDATLNQQFSWMLSAYPDYAVIGHKAHDDAHSAWFAYVERLEAKQQIGLQEFSRTLEQAQQREGDYHRECQQLKQENAELAEAQGQLHQVLNSRSWRITQPLRSGVGLARSVSGPLCRISVTLMRRAAGIAWLNRLANRGLAYTPELKRRLLGMLAHDAASGPIRAGAFEPQDFIDLEPRRVPAVAHEAFALRDAHLSEPQLAEAVKGLRLEGHINGSYSLASVNRHLLQRLMDDRPDMALWLVPHESRRESRVTAIPSGNEIAARLNSLTDAAAWRALPAQRRVALYHHYPLLPVPGDSDDALPVALFFWEESWVPEDMVATLNRYYAGVIVTAWFVKKVLMDSGCRVPVQVIALPLVTNPLGAQSRVGDLDRVAHGQRLELLHVSSSFPRKGVDVLLRAFDELAAEDPGLHLTLKTFPNPHNNVEALIKRLVTPKHFERLTLILDDYTSEQMAALYRRADIVVLPTRGEGLNMPAIEAGEFSRGLVVTGQGAHTDFATVDTAEWTGFCFDHARSHFQQGDAIWTEPGHDSTVDAVRTLAARLRENPQAAHKRIQALHDRIHARFLSRSAMASVLSALARLTDASAFADSAVVVPNVVMVTTWAESCGIAQYSEHIAQALSQTGARLEVSVLAPYCNVNSAMIPDNIAWQPVWQKGCVPDLAHGSGDLTGRDSVIWLQHHFAFYPLDDTLEMQARVLRERGHCVYITLHITQPLTDFDAARRRCAAAALSAFDRVFVHTLSDLNHLKRLGVVDNVTRMHQGVLTCAPFPECSSRTEVAAGEGPVIGSFGFLLPHKGIEMLIEAFATLCQSGELPGSARLKLMTTVRDETGAREELARCEALIKKRHLESRVDWHTEFQPLERMQQQLAECDVVVLPYQYTQESSSAAVRTAVAACPNILTTPAPIFDEVKHIVWQAEGFTAGHITGSLRHVLNAPEEEKAVYHSARHEWLAQRNWDVIASRYQALFMAALSDRQFYRRAAWPDERSA